MTFQEKKSPRKINFQFSDSIYRSRLDYPNQFIKTEGKQVWIGVDQKNKLEIDLEYAYKILQVLRLRELEGDTSYKEVTSERFKNWISLTNCFRVMLFIFGFSINELRDNDMGSKIIDNFFRGKKLRPVINDLEISGSILEKAETKKFPFALNFYTAGIDGLDEARHSVFVVGVLENGKILCFHKDEYGEGKKTEITTLDKIPEANSLESKYTLHSKEEVSEIIKHLRTVPNSAKKV